MLTKLFRARLWIIIISLFLIGASDVYASIVVRAIVVNPSEKVKRKVPFKTLLPKEIKPENILDSGGLDIAYDAKEGAYVAYKDFELEPKDSVTIEIELEDVWKIPQDETASIRREVVGLVKALANTDYADRANYLQNSIESKLAQIEHTQAVVNPNPGGYISDYRENLERLNAVKIDLASAKSLVAEAKNIAPMLTWKLILAVLIFLGLLGVAFFIIWQRQIKSSAELSQDYGPENPFKQQEEGEQRQSRSDKRSDIDDIEKRLRQ